MALTFEQEVYRYCVADDNDDVRLCPMKSEVNIYRGSFVGTSRGWARPLEAGDPFLGIATLHINNLEGADGDQDVAVRTRGDFLLPMCSAGIEVGRTVYASDDCTLKLTPTGNSLIGTCVGIADAEHVVVRLIPDYSLPDVRGWKTP